MTLLITGAMGFVMSNLALRWLIHEPAARVVAVDLAPPDRMAERFFAPVRDRLLPITGDISAADSLRHIATDYAVSHIVHGAAITPHARTGELASPGLEHAAPRRILEVNLLGTLNMLELARTLPSLRRFIYISSGSVYAESAPTAQVPLPEDGPVDPRTLYPISKHASELIVRRYGELYGLSTVSVRLSGVYGPMDRDTPGRRLRSVPYRVAHLALAGKPIRANTLDGVGDYIHADDVAQAIVLLLKAHRLRHDVYNVAHGALASLRELIGYAVEVLPATRHEIVGDADADIVQDPRRSTGRWGAYDVSRLHDEFGWGSRPLRDGLQDYIRWLRRYEFAETSSADPVTPAPPPHRAV